jgi:hypothetical protein
LKLPAVPHDLTEKNKELLRLLENEQARARLLFMPDQLMRKAEAELRKGHLGRRIYRKPNQHRCQVLLNVSSRR